MESWQQLLRKQSIASLEALVAKFGAEHFPDLARLRQAAENFEFRISPAMVDLIKSPGDPIWRQYVPDLQELEVHDGLVDSLAEDANSPVPNVTHPDDLTPPAGRARGMLADAGIPLGCQTVLLRGVNDDPEVMKRLMQRL